MFNWTPGICTSIATRTARTQRERAPLAGRRFIRKGHGPLRTSGSGGRFLGCGTPGTSSSKRALGALGLRKWEEFNVRWDPEMNGNTQSKLVGRANVRSNKRVQKFRRSMKVEPKSAGGATNHRGSQCGLIWALRLPKAQPNNYSQDPPIHLTRSFRSIWEKHVLSALDCKTNRKYTQ